jgi:hypothetical protein
MHPEVAIQRLKELKAEAANPVQMYRTGDRGEGWKSRVRAVVARSLGPGNDLVSKLDENSYGLSAWFAGTPERAWVDAFARGVNTAVGYIEAAIYELELLQGDDEPVDQRSFDPELWDHVKDLVGSEDWGKVASQTTIFVEDKVRTWAGLNSDMYGKGLYTAVLANDAELRLGKNRGEWEGWRALGAGFAQAIGNVDRHRIQDRQDARRYALGVLGLGSLLLTQLHYEHDELIEEREGV